MTRSKPARPTDLFSAALLLFFILGTPLSAENRLELHDKGMEAYDHGRYKEAFYFLDRFVKEKPFEYEIVDAFFYMGRSKMKMKQYLDALSYFSILKKRFPHSKYRKVLNFYEGESFYFVPLTSRARLHLRDYLASEKEPGKNEDLKRLATLYLARMDRASRAWADAARLYRDLLDFAERMADGEEKTKLARECYYEIGMITARDPNAKAEAFSWLNKYLVAGGEYTSEIRFLLRRLTIFKITEREGLPENTIADIKVDGDDVYIGTWTSGLVRYSRSTEKFTRIPLPSAQIRDIYIDEDGLYLTSFDGIMFYDKKSGQGSFLTRGNAMFRLAQKVIKDDRHMIFSTLLQGLVQYDIIKKEFVMLGRDSFVKSNETYALAANHQYLAVGTLSDGAVLFDKKSNETHYINAESGMLKQNNVKALAIDGRYLWIATHPEGIVRYDISRRTAKSFDWGVRYPTSLLKREHELWVATSGQGLFIHNEKTGKTQRMTAIQGLSSNDINLLSAEGDYVWLGHLDAGIEVLYSPLN